MLRPHRKKDATVFWCTEGRFFSRQTFGLAPRSRLAFARAAIDDETVHSLRPKRSGLEPAPASAPAAYGRRP
jgi:ribosomal protein S18 acetylase RimI-like enzyme